MLTLVSGALEDVGVMAGDLKVVERIVEDTVGQDDNREQARWRKGELEPA